MTSVKPVSSIVPYVVPRSYITDPTNARLLGHDTWVVLAEDSNGMVAGLAPSALPAFGLVTSAEAWAAALENIDRVFADHVRAQVFPRTERAPPVLVCVGHWLAASCVVMPRLHAWAATHLHDEDLVVSIPQREAMLIFPRGSREDRDHMRAHIRAQEVSARKKLTWELFALGPAGLSELRE